MSDEIVPIVSQFDRVLVGAQRVRELKRGAEPLIELPGKPKAMAVAVEEMYHGKIGLEYLAKIKY